MWKEKGANTILPFQSGLYGSLFSIRKNSYCKLGGTAHKGNSTARPYILKRYANSEYYESLLGFNSPPLCVGEYIILVIMENL